MGEIVLAERPRHPRAPSPQRLRQWLDQEGLEPRGERRGRAGRPALGDQGARERLDGPPPAEPPAAQPAHPQSAEAADKRPQALRPPCDRSRPRHCPGDAGEVVAVAEQVVIDRVGHRAGEHEGVGHHLDALPLLLHLGQPLELVREAPHHVADGGERIETPAVVAVEDALRVPRRGRQRCPCGRRAARLGRAHAGPVPVRRGGLRLERVHQGPGGRAVRWRLCR